MAYCKINGYGINIRQDSLEQSVAESASRGRSPNNAYFWGRAGRPKRVWQMETTPMALADAQSFYALLTQDGDWWNFTAAAAARPLSNSISNLVSERGNFGSSLGSTTAMNRVAADGKPCYDFDGYACTPFSWGTVGALFQEPSSTNILSANNAHPTTNGHLTNSGAATHVADATRYWRGTASVLVTTPANTDYARTSNTTVAGSTRYEFTFWIHGTAGSEPVLIGISDNAAGSTQLSYTLATTSYGRWQRLRVVHTTNPGATTAFAFVQNNSAPTAAQNWAVAGLQLEAQAFRPTTWLAGTTSRTFALNTMRNPTYQRSEGLTIGCWINLLVSQTGTVGANIWALGTANSAPRAVIAIASYDSISMYVIAPGSQLQASGGVLTAGQGWKHVVGVYDPVALSAKIYVNGALIATDTTWTSLATLDLTALPNTAYLGSDVVSLPPFHGPIAGVFALPRALSASAIAGIYSATASAPGIAPLLASGDFLPADERDVAVHAVVNGVRHHAQQIGSAAWASNNASLRFTLEEA